MGLDAWETKVLSIRCQGGMCCITFSPDAQEAGNACQDAQDAQDTGDAGDATQDAQDTRETDSTSHQNGRNGPASDAQYFLCGCSSAKLNCVNRT